MKRGLKGILSLLLAFMLCAGLFSVFDVNTVNAAGYVVHSGTKDGVSYRIEKNGSDTKLILGNGGEQSFTDKASREKSDWNYGGYTLRITSVKFDGIVHGNGSMAYMFSNMTGLKSIDLRGFETSNVTSMKSMFYQCSGLTSLDVSNFNTSKVTDMQSMFCNCSSLTSLDVSKFDTSKVTNMGYMFSDCSSLSSLDVSNFNTSKVTNMGSMFSSCSSLTSLDVSKFDTSKVTQMTNMFDNCSKLTSLDLSGFDTSNVTNMSQMFYYCDNLVSLDLSNFDTSKLTNMKEMFAYCNRLETLDLYQFDMSNVSSGANAFAGMEFSRLHLGPSAVINPTDLNRKSVGFRVIIPAEKDGIYYTGNWIREDGVYSVEDNITLILNWSPEKAGWWIWEVRPHCNVQFAAGGDATGAMPNTTLFSEEDFEIPTCQYAIFDHTFQYWDDGQGHHYENGATIPAGTYEAGTTITLTAVFEKSNHHINMQDGAFEFSIKAGEKATFNDIPAGTSYQVYEKTEEGWVLVQQENASGVIEALEESAAVFWNKYQPGIVTVQFTGTKKLDGHPAEAGSYSFELLDENRNVIQTKTLLDGGFIQFDAIEFTKKDLGEHTYIIREIDPQDDNIDYDVHEEVVKVLVKEKDSESIVHSSSSNIDFNGNKLHDYDSYQLFTDVISNPGADNMHLNVKYSNVRGQFYIWQGDHSADLAQLSNNGSGSISGWTSTFNPNTAYRYYSYASGKDNMLLTDELDVPGDTVTILYCCHAYASDGSYPYYNEFSNYGYYITTMGKGFTADVIYDEDGVAFNNTTRPGILKITKDGSELTEANKDDKFTFEITFSNENGMPISDNIYWYVEDQN